MQDWMLPRITDYWDQQVDAIERLSRGLEGVPDTELSARLEPISAAVKRHASMLSDEQLRLAAMIMVEDLYKSFARTSRIDTPLLAYLHASSRTLLEAVATHGYVVEYFIDNTWERLDGPVIGFPELFRSAGLMYLCPQELAACQFEKGTPAEQWPALISKYIADGRAVADDLAELCHKDGRHFVYLDIDATEFPAARKHIREQGVIHVFRSEAPTPGSRCVVTMPPSPRPPNATPAAKSAQ
jgi:hypothetical protein